MNTEKNPGRADPAINPPSGSLSAKRLGRLRLASVARWLHIYVSLFTLTVVLFFSVTGLTLNHPDWSFGIHEHRADFKGQLPAAWVQPSPSSDAKNSNPNDASSIAKLEIVETLRKTHRLNGSVEEFRVDDRECMISFKGPGYSADVFIQRNNGNYELSEIRQGAIAFFNDLHKGRHTGAAWAWVIDWTALLLVAISLSGFVLHLYLRRRRTSGFIVAVSGTALVAGIAWLLIP